MSRFRAFTLSAAVLFGASAVAAAQPYPLNQENSMMTAIQHDTLPLIFDTHAQVDQRGIEVDGEAAILTRYERCDGRNGGLEASISAPSWMPTAN